MPRATGRRGWQAFVRGYDRIVWGLSALAGVLIAAATVLIVVDVGIRTVGVPPPAYTIAVVEYAMLYVTMFAAPNLVHNRGHVYIDAVITRLPRVLERAIAKLTYGVAIVVSVAILYLSWQLLVESYRSGYFDERGIDVPQWLLYVPIPIGFGLVAVEFARILFSRDLMHRSRTTAEGSV